MAKAPGASLDFNHAMIYCSDVARSLQFYFGLLGFKPVEIYQAHGMPVYARLRAPGGSGTIALHLPDRGETLPPSDGMRLYFEVKDLEKFCKQLESEGVKFEGPKLMPWGWKHAYLDDPDGHQVSLYWAGAKRYRRSKMSAAPLKPAR